MMLLTGKKHPYFATKQSVKITLIFRLGTDNEIRITVDKILISFLRHDVDILFFLSIIVYEDFIPQIQIEGTTG